MCFIDATSKVFYDCVLNDGDCEKTSEVIKEISASEVFDSEQDECEKEL